MGNYEMWHRDNTVKYLQSKIALLFECAWRFCNGQVSHLGRVQSCSVVLHLCSEKGLCALTELRYQGNGQQQHWVSQWSAGVCILLVSLWRIVLFLCKLGKISFCCPTKQMMLEQIHYLGVFSLSAVPLLLSSNPLSGMKEPIQPAVEEGRTVTCPGIRETHLEGFARRQSGFCWSSLMGGS